MNKEPGQVTIRCKAYRCERAVAPGPHAFCPACAAGASQDTQRELLKAISKYGRRSADYLSVLNRARVEIAKYQRLSEDDISQMRHHDDLRHRKTLRQQVDAERRKFAEQRV